MLAELHLESAGTGASLEEALGAALCSLHVMHNMVQRASRWQQLQFLIVSVLGIQIVKIPTLHHHGGIRWKQS